MDRKNLIVLIYFKIRIFSRMFINFETSSFQKKNLWLKIFFLLKIMLNTYKTIIKLYEAICTILKNDINILMFF